MRKKWLYQPVLPIIVFGLLFGLQCTKDFSNSPETKENVDRIVVVSELTSSSPRIAIGGAQAVIEAHLSDQNDQPVADEPVQFSTSLGQITPVDTTDGMGIARAVLTSGLEPGAAIVKAQYHNEHSRTITVYFDSTFTNFYTVNTSKKTILANGVDSVAIKISVRNSQGTPQQNIPLEFTSSAGHFDQYIVRTDSLGIAHNIFRGFASDRDSVATVSISSQEWNYSSIIEIRGIEFYLEADPQFLIANGLSTSQIRAVLKEATRKIAIPGARIYFATDLGTIPSYTTTGLDGVATVELTSSKTLGTAHVVAFYGDGLVDTTFVDFIQSEPAYLYVSVNNPLLPADNSSQAEIQVRITDINNDPIPDGFPVHFSIQRGSGSIDPLKKTTNGLVKNYLTAGNKPDTTVVLIQAGSLQDSVTVIYTVGEPAFLELTSDSSSILADGITTTTLRARVTDKTGNPVRDGTTVRFESSIGDVTDEAVTRGGVAEAQFSSNETGVAVVRASVGSISDEITITLRPGKAASIILTYDPQSLGVKDSGRNQTVQIVADVRDSKNNNVSDGTLVRFSIFASPQGGETLSTYEPVPTVNGKAQVSLMSGTRSGTVRIQAEVVDADGSPVVPPVRAVSTEIIIHAGPPYIENVNDRRTSHLSVGADPLNILGWHFVNNTATITAVVGDKYNNPVPPGTAVYFTTTGGVISTHTGYTNEEGVATVTLHSAQPYPTVSRFYNTFFDPNANHPDFQLASDIIPGPIPDFEGSQVLNSEGNLGENDGIVRILATTEGVDANGNKAVAWGVTQLVFSGLINTFTVELAESDTAISPGESAHIRIQIYDVNGNPIVPGSTISAEASAGALSWTSLVTSDPGVTLFDLYLTNNLDPTNPDARETSTPVTIKVNSENGNAVKSTRSIRLKLE